MPNLNTKVKQQLLNELENLTRGMSIPFNRQKDLSWLLENIETSNPSHKNLSKIIKICKLLREEEDKNG
jgi:hypothetical protein